MLQTIGLLYPPIETQAERSQVRTPSQQSPAKILTSRLTHKFVVLVDVEDGSSMIKFPLVIADSEQDMPGIKPGDSNEPLCGWVSSYLYYVIQNSF